MIQPPKLYTKAKLTTVQYPGLYIKANAQPYSLQNCIWKPHVDIQPIQLYRKDRWKRYRLQSCIQKPNDRHTKALFQCETRGNSNRTEKFIAARIDTWETERRKPSLKVSKAVVAFRWSDSSGWITDCRDERSKLSARPLDTQL